MSLPQGESVECTSRSSSNLKPWTNNLTEDNYFVQIHAFYILCHVVVFFREEYLTINMALTLEPIKMKCQFESGVCVSERPRVLGFSVGIPVR